MTATTPSRRRGWRIAAAAVVIILSAVVIGGLTFASSTTVRHLPYQSEFCFAEWCVTPTSYDPGGAGVNVDVRVRSDAKAASQHPDHPQAWLVEQTGSQAGGPQPALARLVGPGESYDATLVFSARSPGSCPRLLMSEGAWPAFLGLGYAASPFTELVEWPLCATAG